MESQLRRIPRWGWIVIGVLALTIVLCCGIGIGAAGNAAVESQPSVTQTHTTPATTTQPTTITPTTQAPEMVSPVVDLCAPYLEKAHDFAQSDKMSGQPTITKVGAPGAQLYAVNATWVRPALTAQFNCRVWQGNLQYAQYSTQDRRVDLITGHTM